MWITAVNNPDCPEGAVHQFLWGYFPDMADGAERPFLYRRLGETVLMLSRVKPAYPSVNILERITAGTVYQFDVLASPRNGYSVAGDKARHKHRYLRKESEIRPWLGRRLVGAEVTFAQIQPSGDASFKNKGRRVSRPSCSIRGTLRVTDRAEFMGTLLRGIGGGGAWGFGLLVLPEVMSGLRD